MHVRGPLRGNLISAWVENRRERPYKLKCNQTKWRTQPSGCGTELCMPRMAGLWTPVSVAFLVPFLRARDCTCPVPCIYLHIYRHDRRCCIYSTFTYCICIDSEIAGQHPSTCTCRNAGCLGQAQNANGFGPAVVNSTGTELPTLYTRAYL